MDELSNALKRLEQRTGYVMDDDDPMRPAAAQVELQIQAMMDQHDLGRVINRNLITLAGHAVQLSQTIAAAK